MTLSLDQLAEAIHTARSGIPWEVTSQQDLALRDARAVLSAIEAQGYAVVPREPTPEMIASTLPLVGSPSERDRATARRAIVIIAGGDNSPNGDTAAAELARDWRAMLQSAPKIGDA